MERIDIEACLKSMEILIDTREREQTERAKKRYSSFGVPYKRQKLNYGDYTYNFTLPDGKKLFNSDSVNPEVMIERKMSLEELSSCLTHDRDRFKAEFERAEEQCASIYLLVENASWENLMNGKYKTKFNSSAFTASLIAWSVRYGIKIYFCKSETSGRLIKEILYRELKEKLESGEYG